MSKQVERPFSLLGLVVQKPTFINLGMCSPSWKTPRHQAEREKEKKDGKNKKGEGRGGKGLSLSLSSPLALPSFVSSPIPWLPRFPRKSLTLLLKCSKDLCQFHKEVNPIVGYNITLG